MATVGHYAETEESIMRSLRLLIVAVLCIGIAAPATAQPLTRDQLIKVSHDTWDMLDAAVKRGDIASRYALGLFGDFGYLVGRIDRPEPTALDILQARETLTCIEKRLVAQNLRLPDSVRPIMAWLESETRTRHADAAGIVTCKAA